MGRQVNSALTETALSAVLRQAFRRVRRPRRRLPSKADAAKYLLHIRHGRAVPAVRVAERARAALTSSAKTAPIDSIISRRRLGQGVGA